MHATPPLTTNPYNQQLSGVYGEFGSGSGLQAFYLQSAISPPTLDKISLISDIPGSDRWPIRELFQRDVDRERVTTGLLPYLRDAGRIKFFNPLTLTVLPMDSTDGSVLNQMPRVIQSTSNDDGGNWFVLERSGYYRIRWIEHHPEYARLEWNDNRSRLVAIDGQHRLFALKRLQADPSTSSRRQEFLQWRIPVVVVSFRATEGREDPPSVLDVVRSIFVYINKEAQTVNAAREILLSDESICAVCTQEVLQHSHANDTLPPGRHDTSRMPLLFYDWRGEERDGKRIPSPAAVKTVDEIHAWLHHYLLGDDFSDAQEVALGVMPTDTLKAAFHEKRLTPQAADLARQRFRDSVMPGLVHLLEQFTPYRRYIAELRALERESTIESHSDLVTHAFDHLRFGSHHAPDALASDVQSVVEEMENRIHALKSECLPELIANDIGMRGIVWAFGYLHGWAENAEWSDHAREFTTALNRVFDDEWLDVRPRATHRSSLRHVVQDHNETIVNYRLGHAENALGPYVALLVVAHGVQWAETWPNDWRGLREALVDELHNTVIRGYKKEVRPQLREQYPNGGKELTAAVDHRAREKAGRQMRRFERKLDAIVRGANEE